MTISLLIPKLATFAPALIIFDKDGTLIDFQAMWGHWVIELARRLEDAAGLPITDRLFKAIDFDPDSGYIAPDGHLAVTPAAGIQALIISVLESAGLSPKAAQAILTAAWHTPDPVTSAHPFTDLKRLFTTLQSKGAKIAIATSDDRPLTEATLAGLGLTALVDALACADDGLPIKPAPDMVTHLCQALNISPAKTAMIGDNVVDLQMGRAAGVGLTIGVLSGVSPAAALAPYADFLLESIDALLDDTR